MCGARIIFQRMKTAPVTTLLTCRFCFSFLRERHTLRHVKKYHEAYYQQIKAKKSRGLKKNRNRNVDVSLAFCEFKLKHSFVNLTRIQLDDRLQKQLSETTFTPSIISQQSSHERKCKDQAKLRIFNLTGGSNERDELGEKADDNWTFPHFSKRKQDSKTNKLPAQSFRKNRKDAQQCPLCKRFYKSTFLDYHLRQHRLAEAIEIQRNSRDANTSGEAKPYTCKLCLIISEDKSTHLQHFVEAHSGNSDTYICLTCDSKQLSIDFLLHHVRVTHPEILGKKKIPDKGQPTEGPSSPALTEKFPCKKCEKTMLSQRSYGLHLAYHERIEERDKLKQFRCPTCDKRFTRKDHLVRHRRLHDPNNPFVCQFPGCNRVCDTHNKLREHTSLHYFHEKFQCEFCSANYTRQERLKTHVRKFHQNPNGNPPLIVRRRLHRVPKAADIIDQTQGLNATFTLNVKNENETREPIIGPENEAVKVRNVDLGSIHLIDKVVLNENGESVHIKGEQLEDIAEDIPTSITSNSIVDNDCKDGIISQIIHSKEKFNEQLKAHIESMKYKCDECSTGFNRSWMLKLHLKTIHKRHYEASTSTGNSDGGPAQANEITLLCGTCGFMAKSQKDLELHMSTAPRHGKKLPCTMCGISFTNLSRLRQHQEDVHFREKKYKCDECDKKFARKSSIRKHKASVHTKVLREKVECPECPKRFARSYLNTHLASEHSGENQRICRSNNKSTLVKPQCKLCKDEFATPMALRRHIQLVHMGKPVPTRVKGKLVHSSGTIQNELVAGQSTKEMNKNNNVNRETEKCADFTSSLEILGF